MVELGKFLTIDNLHKRSIWVLDWCHMRKCNGDMVEHLLLHCSIAMGFWSMVFGLFGVYRVMPKTIVDMLASWQQQFNHHSNEIVWKVVPRCFMWYIWREQNAQSLKLQGCSTKFAEN